MSPETSRRRYRIQGVIGQGGFGSVYRAHMEGPEGFRKDVAIKLLRDADPPREVLQRFRDEARILGLVRDRAVVTVDPPVRLNGRWAVVMEYVDGVSLRALIEAHGRIPPGPALQIVGEVARALDKLWHQEGPDGSPLSLLHRDLKPANLQLTRAGEVKVLDFGIAKASFSERETTTTNALAGTVGYMAPERLAGSEGPTTDVFSLGIVLWELVLGSRPRLEEVMDDEPLEGELAEVLGLVRRMCAINPEERPSTREVERACRQASRGLEPDLRDWADQAVPEASWADDPMAGTVLTETLLLDPPVTPPPGGRAAWFVGGASLLTLIASGAVGAGALVFVAVLALRTGSPPEPTPSVPDPRPIAAEPTPAPPQPVPAEPVQTEPEPRPAPPAAPPPTPTVPDPAPVAVAPVPSPAPRAPDPAPVASPEAVRTWRVVFASVPPGAVVRVDGKARGTTPVSLDVPEGRHDVRLEAGNRGRSTTVEVGYRQPERYLWRVEQDTWEASSPR